MTIDEKVKAEWKRLKALSNKELFPAEYMAAHRQERIEQIIDDFRVELDDTTNEELFFASTRRIEPRNTRINELLEEFRAQAQAEEEAKEQASEIVRDELQQ